MATRKAKISDLTPDPHNANLHSEYGMGLLANSTRMNGLGRSILISNDNVIIAGNGLAEAAGEIGIEDVEIIETDGTKIIAVKRKDIESGTAEFYNMALADNITALKNIVMDADVVEALAEHYDECKPWAAAIANEPRPGKTSGREDLVEVKLSFTTNQHSKFKQAMKVGKQKFNVEGESDSEQSNILIKILSDYIKANQ